MKLWLRVVFWLAYWKDRTESAWVAGKFKSERETEYRP